ncbi:MAG TPA: hypothetical protein VJK29_15255 [Terriglobales bacterium]|nr:hypothetical protein [Terriglobales bacterium]
MRFWFLVLFVLQLMVGATSGGDDTLLVERTSRVTSAVLQFSGVLLGYFLLFGKEMFGGKVFWVERKTLWAFLMLAVWVFLDLFAMGAGFWLHYETTYVLGDFYKFLLLPLLFVLAYFGLRSRRQLDTVLKGLVAVMGIALLVDFVRRYTWITQYGGRFMTSSTFHIATVTPLVLYLLLCGKGSRFFRQILWAVGFEICASIVLLQGLSDYVYVGLLMLLFSYFFRSKKLVLAVVLLAGVGFIGLADPFNFWGEGNYLSRKLAYATVTAAGSQLGLTERVTGSRIGEIIGILRAYANSPAQLPFGFGMGALDEALPITMAEIPKTEFTPWWQPIHHFIHSGLFEIFYRTGFAGLVALFGLFIHAYRRGQRLACGPHRDFGRFVMANSVYQLANIAIQTPITYVWLFFVIPLVGSYIVERAAVQAGTVEISPRMA